MAIDMQHNTNCATALFNKTSSIYINKIATKAKVSIIAFIRIGCFKTAIKAKTAISTDGSNKIKDAIGNTFVNKKADNNMKPILGKYAFSLL